MGTSLVTFSNFSKVDQVQEWMQARDVPTGWIGLHKPEEWSWSSGTTVAYTNWQNGEPNLSQVDGACATLSTTTSKWNYANCSQLLPFFCSGGAAFSFVSSRICQHEVVKVFLASNMT